MSSESTAAPAAPQPPQQLTPSGKVEVTGVFEFRNAEGEVVGRTPFVWTPPKEALE